MTLPDAQRARYLEALGIDLWVRRGQAAATTEFAASTPVPVPEAAAPARRAPPASVEPVAADWEGLRQQVLACTRCALHQGRTQAVFASGDRQARWMVIGENLAMENERIHWLPVSAVEDEYEMNAVVILDER